VNVSQHDHTSPLPKLQFATTLPPIVPLTDDDYQELYEAEEQFGKAVGFRLMFLFSYVFFCQQATSGRV